MTFPGEQQGRWCIAGKHRAAKLYSGTMASPHSMCAHAQVSLLSEGPCICALLHACLTRLRAPWFQQSHFLSCSAAASGVGTGKLVWLAGRQTLEADGQQIYSLLGARMLPLCFSLRLLQSALFQSWHNSNDSPLFCHQHY